MYEHETPGGNTATIEWDDEWHWISRNGDLEMKTNCRQAACDYMVDLINQFWREEGESVEED